MFCLQVGPILGANYFCCRAVWPQPYPPRSCRPNGCSHRVLGLHIGGEGRIMSACPSPPAAPRLHPEPPGWVEGPHSAALSRLGKGGGAIAQGASGGKRRVSLCFPCSESWIPHYWREYSSQPQSTVGRDQEWRWNPSSVRFPSSACSRWNIKG